MSTSSVTARRRPGSLAVETTPAGLFTAQTSRGSGSTGAPSTSTPLALVHVAGRVGDDLAADA